jgi:hypothetical protein
MQEDPMCDMESLSTAHQTEYGAIPLTEAVGLVLAHDITEIRRGEFKGRAFRKGHVVKPEDICHLQRLGKENLFVLRLTPDDMHENDAARAMAEALIGEGVRIHGEPKEGKIDLVADRDGMLSVNKEALLCFNMLGDVMCSTLHNATLVKEGQKVAGTRAIPLVVKRSVVEEAVRTARGVGSILSVKPLRKPRAGIVITGNEVYYGRIQDAFAPVIQEKLQPFGGEIVGVHYAPDDERFIVEKTRALIDAGADLIITTGGMSVDPDDVTRFAIRSLGASNWTYGSPVLPGAMFLIAYLDKPPGKARKSNGNGASRDTIPVLGIPACGMYARITLFDILLPRVLAGERIGRREIAELGHGGLCMKCRTCAYPACPFGK